VRCIVSLYGEGLARIPAVLAEDPAGSALCAAARADERCGGLCSCCTACTRSRSPSASSARSRACARSSDRTVATSISCPVDDATGAVRLRFEGTCDGCPASRATLRHSVATAIRAEAPEVGEIAVDESHKSQTVPLYSECRPVGLGHGGVRGSTANVLRRFVARASAVGAGVLRSLQVAAPRRASASRRPGQPAPAVRVASVRAALRPSRRLVGRFKRVPHGADGLRATCSVGPDFWERLQIP
jgi:hypothetical protein